MAGYKKRRIQASEEDSEGEPMSVAKKVKTTKPTKAASSSASKAGAKATDAEGNAYWELGNNRRIGASKFKNVTLVNIREYYTTSDGEARPGKKGISLSLDQYKAFLKVIPQLNEELRSQGLDVGDVSVSSSSSASAKKPAASVAETSSKKAKKSNIEQTSEEEEEEEEDSD
ncbi:putative RNA polymerase II transcriptional coactivator [Podospora australis]|uniref:RNA polymerase II transcriptional coactivator n=1 Tax=Podospora australis TaxID=1536484 RepID=A0AAN6X4D3_9PEZI|nr:putative RNA polymerase II transcriptional coactivator [Podospora australis]